MQICPRHLASRLHSSHVLHFSNALRHELGLGDLVSPSKGTRLKRGKGNMTLGNSQFQKEIQYIGSKGGFPIVMLVFWGVSNEMIFICDS